MRQIRPYARSDDEALRRLAALPMPGIVSLSYPHEPDFLQGESLKGDIVMPLVFPFRDGSPAGCGSVAVRNVYWRGMPVRIGYLGGLRVFPEARHGYAVYSAYRFLRGLDSSLDVPFYFTTILDANEKVKKLLTGRRAGLPPYHDSGKITSFAMTPDAILRKCSTGGARVLNGSEIEWDDLLKFYREHAGSRDFFPVIPENPDVRHLKEDIIAVVKEDRIVAAGMLCSPGKHRQIRIHSYHPILSLFRGAVNVFSRLMAYPVLPPEKSDLPYRCLARLMVDGDTPEFFDELLAAAARRMNSGEMLLAAFHERDPLLAMARRINSWKSSSTLYLVLMDDNAQPPVCQIPYFELAEI